MHGLMSGFKDVLNNYTLGTILVFVLFSLVVDGNNFKKEGFIKEYKIVSFLSYSYIILSILIFVLQGIS